MLMLFCILLYVYMCLSSTELGYKGFTLIHVPPGSSATDGGHYNHTVSSATEWEMVLLSTSDGIDEDLRHHAKTEITKSPVR